MPAKKTVTTTAVTAGQAQYVLRRLIEERRISQKDVARYAGDMQREIAALEERLRLLREAADNAPRARSPRRQENGVPAEQTAERTPRGKGRRRRRKQNLSPERRAALKLQGQYLALIRRVPARKRPKYKKLLQAKGHNAAIKAMQQATGK